MRIRQSLAAALTAATVVLSLSHEASASPPAAAPPASTKAGALAAQLPALEPRAVAWAEHLAAAASRTGSRISPRLQALARKSGVRRPGDIRLVVVHEIPLPDDAVLRKAALDVGMSQSEADGMTLGHAVFVRRGYQHDVRLLSHEFRHVAQYEACGGIRQFLSIDLAQLAQFGYEAAPFEVDARAHEVNVLPAAVPSARPAPAPKAARQPRSGAGSIPG